ncbi:MAG: hypothetical protein PF445_01045, partial [Melioribacteraceae bacterium]|nr:hypothetical protein [Melioribacteraceae bacterium]
MKKIFIVLIILLLYGCKKEHLVEDTSLVNSSHLDYLYEEISNECKTFGIIHIYSEYPDYHFVDAESEGTACVDDVARALVFYNKDYEYNGNIESLRKSKQLVKFILHLEAEDSTYYNFVFEDGQINKTFRTSVSGFQWWMWRALWSMAESYETINSSDEVLASEILTSLNKGFSKT